MRYKLFLIVIIILLPFICQAAESLEDRLYYDAEEAYLKADYELARAQCKKLVSLYPESKDTPHAVYLEGLCLLKAGYYPEARTILNKVISGYSESDIVPDALLAYGDAFLLENKLDSARLSYERLLKKYPKSQLLSQALFRLVQIYRKDGNWKKARALCEKLMAKYPDTIEAKDAKEIIEGNEFYFTIQVGSFADRTNAQKLCDELSTKGYNSYIQEFKGEIARFYRVRVGKINGKQDAVFLEAKLKSESLPTKIIP